MNALRDDILALLRGSSIQKPIAHAVLRKKFGESAEDSKALKEELDKLLANHTILRTHGMREGRLDYAYWLSGTHEAKPPQREISSFPLSGGQDAIATATPAPGFKLPQLPAAKPQPNTSTSKETDMPQTQSAPVIGVSTAVVAAIKAAPGIKFDALFAAVKKSIPEITEKKLKDNLYQMASINKIEAKGDGEARTYHLGANAEKTRGTAKTKAAPPPKPKKSSPAKAAKASKPERPATAAVSGSGYHFAILPQEDGGLKVHKNGTTLDFSAHEVRTILEHAN